MDAGSATAVNVGSGFVGTGLGLLFQKQMADKKYQRDKRMFDYMADYNSPKNQMQRYRDAGLNPALMYGQGNPGNVQNTPQYPQYNTPNMEFLAGLGTQIQQAKLLSAQANLTNQKVDESGIKQDLMQSQKALIDANPMLNKGYVESLVTMANANAGMKKQQADFMLQGQVQEGRFTGEAGMVKMQYELKQLEQKYNLNNSDIKIRSEIFNSKVFQNSINEVMSKWMTDGEISPEHYRLFVMMLMQKFK